MVDITICNTVAISGLQNTPARKFKVGFSSSLSCEDVYICDRALIPQVEARDYAEDTAMSLPIGKDLADASRMR